MSFLAGIGGKLLAGLAAAAALAWAAFAIIGRLMAAGADKVKRRNAETGNRNVEERRDVEDAIARASPDDRRRRLHGWHRD